MAVGFLSYGNERTNGRRVIEKDEGVDDNEDHDDDGDGGVDRGWTGF